MSLVYWRYYRKITVTNSGSTALTDYQIKVSLDNTNFDFSKANVDGSDIRFTDSDGTTLLSYWIEAYDSSGQTATIWVKVPSIPTSSTKTIYLYYGNAGATSASNGDDTFIFFDDFDESSLDTTKWLQINGNASSLSNGLLSISANGYDPGKLIAQTAPDGDNYVLRARLEITGQNENNTDGRIGLSIKTSTSNGTGYNFVFHHIQDPDEVRFLDDKTAWGTIELDSWALNTWYVEEIFHDGTNVQARINDDVWYSQNWSGRTGYPALNIGSQNENSVWDFALVRKYSGPEPTNSVGSEQASMSLSNAIMFGMNF